MRIGRAAKQSGISAKAIRYYERIGLVRPIKRLGSGYREYSIKDIEFLHLIQRARDAGLSPRQAAEIARLCEGGISPAAMKRANTLLAKIEARANAARDLADFVRQRMRDKPTRTQILSSRRKSPGS